MKSKLKEERNLYYKEREALGLSREKASLLLETIPPERLERIENEKSQPYPEEVLQMAEKYKNPALANYYCSHECPIGQRYVPEIKVKELSDIVLRTLAALNRVQKQKERLIEITSNGRVDDDEVKDFVDIQEDLEQISVAVEALQFWTEQKLADGLINTELYHTLREEHKAEMEKRYS